MACSGRYMGGVVVGEPVPGAVVSVALVVLAGGLQRGFVGVDLRGGGVLVVVAEQAQQRRGQFGGVVDRGDRTGWAGVLECGHDAAPQVDHGVEARGSGRDQQRVPPARAGAQDAGLAVAAGPGLEPGQRGGAVGHDAVIAHAAFAAGFREHVIGAAVPEPAIQVRADHLVAVAGEPFGELLVELVPARHVVHKHHAPQRPVSVRAGDVGVDLIPAPTGIGRDLRGDTDRTRGRERIPHHKPPTKKPTTTSPA